MAKTAALRILSLLNIFDGAAPTLAEANQQVQAP
jgi:hypothetical protein